MVVNRFGEVDEPSSLEKLRVNPYPIVYGFIPEQFDCYDDEQTEFGGWTFANDDAVNSGVRNVTYESERQHPSAKAFEEYKFHAVAPEARRTFCLGGANEDED